MPRGRREREARLTVVERIWHRAAEHEIGVAPSASDHPRRSSAVGAATYHCARAEETQATFDRRAFGAVALIDRNDRAQNPTIPRRKCTTKKFCIVNGIRVECAVHAEQVIRAEDAGTVNQKRVLICRTTTDIELRVELVQRRD